MASHADILDHIKVAIVVVDTAFEIRYLNHTAEDFCGGSSEQFQGRNITSLFTGEDVRPDALRKCFSDYETYTLRDVVLTISATGQRAHANIAVAPISSHELIIEIEPLDRFLLINKSDQMQSAQLASQHLVRGMAHEIKNPLGGIRGAAQLLQQELVDDEQIQYTDVIISESDRLRTLVDQLLGPNQTPCFEPVNIHQIIEKVILINQPEQPASLSIRRQYDPSLPSVLGDYDQLIQAILNIINNAYDALQESTNPRLAIRTRVEHQFTIGDKRHKMVAHIQISDNGAGVPTAIQNQIFFPLVTGKAQGTGLGLAITHTIVGMHHGLITFESQPERTCFDIYLPLALHSTAEPV